MVMHSVLNTVLLLGTVDANCHPLADRTFQMSCVGPRDEQWVGYVDSNHYVYAGYSEHLAVPWYFEAVPDSCDTYYLQNMYEGGDKTYPYVSFTDSGTWLKAYYSKSNAMPIKFDSVGSNRFQMVNKWPGKGEYVSYRDKDLAIRAIYGESDAMIVQLFETKESIAKHPQVESIQLCFNPVYSVTGGSSKETYEIPWGEKESHSYSLEFKKSLAATVSAASHEYAGFQTVASRGAVFKQLAVASIKSASSEINGVLQGVSAPLDCSKACYVVQANLTYHMNDGGSISQSPGQTIYFPAPVSIDCVTVHPKLHPEAVALSALETSSNALTVMLVEPESKPLGMKGATATVLAVAGGVMMLVAGVAVGLRHFRKSETGLYTKIIDPEQQ